MLDVRFNLEGCFYDIGITEQKVSASKPDLEDTALTVRIGRMWTGQTGKDGVSCTELSMCGQ